jgi:hypothetical protein
MWSADLWKFQYQTNGKRIGNNYSTNTRPGTDIGLLLVQSSASMSHESEFHSAPRTSQWVTSTYLDDVYNITHMHQILQSRRNPYANSQSSHDAWSLTYNRKLEEKSLLRRALCQSALFSSLMVSQKCIGLIAPLKWVLKKCNFISSRYFSNYVLGWTVQTYMRRRSLHDC